MAKDWMSKYMKRNKANEIHYTRNVSDETLISLTKSMTSVCFMARPACKQCDFCGDALYCPPAAADKELLTRGYEKVEIQYGIRFRSEYKKPSIAIHEFAEV